MADPTKDGQGSVTDPNLTDEEKLAAIEKAKGLEDAAAAGGSGDQGGAGADGAAGTEDAEYDRLSSFMRKKGINDVGKLVELAENLEKRNTQLDQDVRRLSAVGRFPAVGEGVVQPGVGRQAVATVDDDLDIEVPDNPLEIMTDPKKLKEFSKKLVLAGRDMARKETQAERYEQAKVRVQTKMAENPQEFAKLRPIMLELSRSNPDADIDQLYGAAKNIYTEDRKGLVNEVKAELGLADQQDPRLKAVLGRLRQAPVSGGTGPQVTVAGDAEAKKKGDANFLKAIMDSDKY